MATHSPRTNSDPPSVEYGTSKEYDKEAGIGQEQNGLTQETSMREGELNAKFKKLGWKRLTICLIVEAIALGSLSIPKAFASVGMIAGVILCIGIGLLAIYTSYVVGQVKLKYPDIDHYADAVKLIWGRFGYELASTMFVLLLVLLVGSHALTGTIAWVRIVEKDGICALVWSVISAILLFALAIPPTFAEFAILGYIDFVSIILAIGITIVATGVQSGQQVEARPWSAYPPDDVTLSSAFLAITNIVFAYSFAVCQFSFMSELHTPKDYVKSIWSLGLIEMFIYTLTGGLIYSFVGQDVKSPALLSASTTVSRVAFGIALPVIFISGSINSTVVGRFIMTRAFKNSEIKYIHNKAGWTVWILMLIAITVIAWLIAEAIPFFSDLLGIISSLFISGFSFYFPALFWFLLIKQGKWYKGWKNITLSLLNALCFLIGIAVLGLGTYASVKDIIDQYTSGAVRSPFSCDSESYAG